MRAAIHAARLEITMGNPNYCDSCGERFTENDDRAEVLRKGIHIGPVKSDAVQDRVMLIHADCMLKDDEIT